MGLALLALLALTPPTAPHPADEIGAVPRVVSAGAGASVAVGGCALGVVGFVAVASVGAIACAPVGVGGAVVGVGVVGAVVEGLNHVGVDAAMAAHVGFDFLGFVGGALVVGAGTGWFFYGAVDDVPGLYSAIIGGSVGAFVGGALGAGVVEAILTWQDLEPRPGRWMEATSE